jgi:hypothetical protein
MRAVALADFETEPALMDLPVPEPGPGETLIRVRTASVNGFDLVVISGALKEMMEHRFPVILGKDFADRGRDPESRRFGLSRSHPGDLQARGHSRGLDRAG